MPCYLPPKVELTPEQEECLRQVDSEVTYADYGPCANFMKRKAKMSRCNISDDTAIGAYECLEIDGKAEYVGTYFAEPYQPCPGARSPYEERKGYVQTCGAIFRDVKARTDKLTPGAYSQHSFVSSCYDCRLNAQNDSFELARNSDCSGEECLPVDKRPPCFDSDDDGMPDEWEKMYGLNPDDPSDARGDADSDGLSSQDEFENGTDPLNPDTDGDKMGDKWEADNKTDPADPSDADKDPDKDGATNKQEHDAGSNPNDPGSVPVPADPAGQQGGNGGNGGDGGDGGAVTKDENGTLIGSFNFDSIWTEKVCLVNASSVNVNAQDQGVSLSLKTRGAAWVSKIKIKQAARTPSYKGAYIMTPFEITAGVNRKGLEPGEYSAKIKFKVKKGEKIMPEVYYCEVYLSVLASGDACQQGMHFKNVAQGSAWRLQALRQYQSALDNQLKETSGMEEKKVIAAMRDSLGYEIDKVSGQNATARYIYDYLRNYPILSEDDKQAIENVKVNWDERGLTPEQSQLLQDYISSWEDNVYYNNPSSYWEELDKELRASCPPSTWGISAFFKGAAKEGMLLGMGLISAGYEIVQVPGDLRHDFQLVFIDKTREVYNLKFHLSELYVTEETWRGFLAKAAGYTAKAGWDAAYNMAYGITVVGCKQGIWDNLTAFDPEAAGRGLINLAAFIYGTEKLRGAMKLEKIAVPELKLGESLLGSGGLQFAFEGAQGAGALAQAGTRTVASFKLGGDFAAGGAAMAAVATRRIPVKYRGQYLGDVRLPETTVRVSEVIIPNMTPLESCLTQAVYRIRQVFRYFAPDKLGANSTLSRIAQEFSQAGVKGINIKLNKVSPTGIQGIDLKLKETWEVKPEDLMPLGEHSAFSISITTGKNIPLAIQKRLMNRIADELSAEMSKIRLSNISGDDLKWSLSALKNKLSLWSRNRAISVVDLQFSFQ